MELPHRTTLQKYTSFTDMCPGYNPDVIQRFMFELKIDTLKEQQKNVSTMFDEMKIKAGWDSVQ